MSAVRDEWKAQAGRVCDHAIRMSLLSDGARGWTLKGSVDVPRYPDEAERRYLVDILIHHAARSVANPPDLLGLKWALLSWEVVRSVGGVVVETCEPIPVITERDIIPGSLEIKTFPEFAEGATERLSAILEKELAISSREYPQNPYLSHVNRRQLSERWAAIARNIKVVDKRGLQTATKMDVWHRLFADIHVETHQRGYPFAQEYNLDWGTELKLYREWDDSLIKKAAGVLRGRTPPRGFVVKYGKREHMRAMYKYGRVRIGSARNFKKSSSDAIQDDELKFEHQGVVMNDGAFVVMSQFTTLFPEERLERYATLTLESTSDFWLYCVSRSLAPELFSDFDEADACVVFNWGKFCPRLVRAVQGVASTSRPRAVDMDYRDPLGTVGGTDILIPVSDIKHFEYSYQNERRIVWKPRVAAELLEPLDVEVGSMRDYATLVEL